MIFQRESAEAFAKDAAPLWIRHYEEIAEFKEDALEPDFERYFQVEKMDLLRIYTIRDKDMGGLLVGYSLFFIHPHAHFMESKRAKCDLLFLERNYRKGILGYRFLKWIDSELKAEGVAAVYHSVTVQKDFSLLLKRLGYNFSEAIYTKRL